MKETETKKPPVKKDPVKKAELKQDVTLTSEMLLKAKLHTKINEVVKRLGAIQEDGKNTAQNFGFISYQKMNAELRKVLPDVGLAISSEVNSYEERDYQNSNGNIFIRTVVVMDFEIVDTETGYSETSKFAGGEQDYGGKSLGQAITECQKRFEFKKFHVSSKDPDPDQDPKPKAEKKEAPISEEKKSNLYGDAIEEIKQEYLKAKLGAEFTAGYKSLGYKGVGELYAETVKAKRDNNYRELQKNLEIFKSAEKEETQADHFDYHAELTRVKEAFEKERWDLEGYTLTHLKKNWIDLPMEQILEEQLKTVKFFNTVIAKGSK